MASLARYAEEQRFRDGFRKQAIPASRLNGGYGSSAIPRPHCHEAFDRRNASPTDPPLCRGALALALAMRRVEAAGGDDETAGIGPGSRCDAEGEIAHGAG